MARFEITGPGGSKYEITAPDNASEADITSYISTHLASLPDKDPVSAGEMAVDVAKSTGMGLVQGGIGLATLPGNLESLARSGINYGADLAGAKPLVSDETLLPTYGDWKQRVEGYTGEFYEPKTTAGEYARTLGEFAPLALSGGTAAAGRLGGRFANVAAPAVASETAGQLTEGTQLEPWARAGGALLGGRVQQGVNRAVSPAPAAPHHAAHVTNLEREGVTAMTAGQRTGNGRIRGLEDATARIPGGGTRAVDMEQQAAEQFTAAALRRAGVNANRAEPQVLDEAFRSIGAEYENFARQTALRVTPGFQNRLQAIVRRYEQITPDGSRVPAIRSAIDDIVSRNPNRPEPFYNIAGRDLAGIRSTLARQHRAVKSNPQASDALLNLIRELDIHAVRSLPPQARRGMLRQLQDRNARYRNLLAIEDAALGAGQNAAQGLISPAALKAAVKKQNKRDYSRGRRDLANLARSGEAVLRPLPSSGTAERALSQGVLAAPASVIGGLGSGSAEGAMLGALAPWAMTAATARGVMNPRTQRYLANQRRANVPPVDIDPNLARILALNQLQRD